MDAVSDITIRHAVPADIPAIVPVIAAAKTIMRSSGNMEQWAGNYPAPEDLLRDMEREAGRVCVQDGRVVGYFAFIPGPDPTYAKIYEGAWLEDTLPYHVIHRIASYPDVHGIFHAIMAYGFAHTRNIRIDTHRDNRIMQHNILKHGYSYCGIIYLEDGAERLAYQRVDPPGGPAAV